MADSRYAPVEAPSSAWRLPGVRRALRDRDVAAMLRLVQQHTGASQARMAAAAGFGQGRFNEIFNGRRRVTSLEALERLAAALGMPDDARVLFGLAPLHAGMLTGHAEIAAVYTVQADASRELRKHAATASSIDILAVRALGLIALNDSLLRGALETRTTPVDVRVLLLNPDSQATPLRAAETGESPEAFAAGIRLALGRLADLGAQPAIRLQTAIYDALPVWRMLAFDDILYLSAFTAAAEGHRSGMYKLAAAGDGVLHAGFRRQFEDTWRHARRR
jgi:transcriptional regulator with XRE-family HTH domain